MRPVSLLSKFRDWRVKGARTGHRGIGSGLGVGWGTTGACRGTLGVEGVAAPVTPSRAFLLCGEGVVVWVPRRNVEMSDSQNARPHRTHRTFKG
jgi:hypothetical protein